jgi:hypothetical protein
MLASSGKAKNQTGPIREFEVLEELLPVRA